MRDDPLNYDRLMEEALRSVVRRALAVAGERGLPGQHHYYVTFRTDLPGVDIPDSLRRRDALRPQIEAWQAGGRQWP